MKKTMIMSLKQIPKLKAKFLRPTSLSKSSLFYQLLRIRQAKKRVKLINKGLKMFNLALNSRMNSELTLSWITFSGTTKSCQNLNKLTPRETYYQTYKLSKPGSL